MRANMLHWHTVGWLAALSIASPLAQAESLFSIKTENDAYVGAGDGHYTNGFEMSWAYETDADHWSHSVANFVPGWRPEEVVGMSYRLGHRIYTPKRITVAAPQPDDRPYAGVLYTGASVHGQDQHDGWHETHSVHVDAGIVGPSAAAEPIQEHFHEYIAGEKPEGWDYQLSDEPFLNIGYEHAWIDEFAIGPLDFEYGPTAGFAAGNLYTYGSGGLLFRFGSHLDKSYGIPSIAPAQGQRAFFRRDKGFGWYVFASAEGRYMAHNMLLDGNTHKDGPSVERKPWVADGQVGFAVNWDRWQLAYTMVWRTKEFETQNTRDRFGSLTLSMWI
ncbi:lipid A deacylase LpxR family protein [Guyparkeria hydrothermalis]|uniref:lipid A deacylase LpxR family protein n=1 Tax=Guyparkeria hydrothermalis TaxID=923 RepID=UPI0020209249|nr:lipid A deacylase LpxR family protein [Guyparkeria hydrothermalis]MCL7743567.1 lipid A deacylase LpxR family protein [Guyparkeria hydrothermalis]